MQDKELSLEAILDAVTDLLDYLGPCNDTEITRNRCAAHGHQRLPCTVALVREALTLTQESRFNA